MAENTPVKKELQSFPTYGAVDHPDVPAGAVPGAPPGAIPRAPPGAMPGAVLGAPAGAVPHAPAGAMPRAPPLNQMESIEGYKRVTFDPCGPLPPPSNGEASRGPPPERGAVSSALAVDEEAAREALLQHVSQHCCYGKAAARELIYQDLKPSSAFHYTLESFGESRTTTWAMEPYSGQPIDGPHNGPAPGPWDIQARAKQKFRDTSTSLEVPHTASVKPCHICVGIGRVRCDKCAGRGGYGCLTCNGSGRMLTHYDARGNPHHNFCHGCNGMGRGVCYTCKGSGQITCKTCQGQTQLKCCIQLTIKWTNHFDDYILDKTDLPDELIRNVTGQMAFEEELPRVWAVNHFPDQRINAASRRLVDRHNTAFPKERILLQRHRVRIVPVTEAVYKWKNEDYNYFVYGFENKVHAPSYPQRCCCGCNIL